MKTYYMLVSRDKFELPLAPPVSRRKMAILTGLREDTVDWWTTPAAYKRMQNHKIKVKPWRIVKVKIEEDENA